MPILLGSLEENRTFRAFLAGEGLSTKTAGIYIAKVDNAILWFAARGGDLVGATAADLAAWASELADSSSTRRQARSALQHYFNWAGRANAPLRAIRVPPKPRYICQAITVRQADELHDLAIQVGFPMGTAVLIGLYLGLRAHEIAGVRWDRFDYRIEKYTVHGKGSYVATLPVHEVLAGQLIKVRTPYVFLFPGSRERDHVHYGTIWKWVREMGRRIGLEDLRPHQLRHTAGATLHDATGDLRATADFLRHRRLETTMIYTRTTEDRLRIAVNTGLRFGQRTML